jgi:hypothetical protein
MNPFRTITLHEYLSLYSPDDFPQAEEILKSRRCGVCQYLGIRNRETGRIVYTANTFMGGIFICSELCLNMYIFQNI